MKLICLALPLCLAAAYAQTSAPAAMEFEVASVKPSADEVDRVNIGVHVDGAQVHIAAFSLQDYIRVAYRVKYFQIVGPEWLSERFNVDAKLPEGANREQIPEMLQALLASRFELKIHHESKEFPVYALSVAATGLKLKESPPDKDGDGTDGVRGGSTDVTASGGRGGVSINYGKGSFFTFADNKLEGKKLSMTNLVELLGRFMDRPVIDRTGLQGNYDISVNLTPEDYRAMLIRSAIAAGVTLPPEALRLLDGASDESLYAALRGYGLKLDPTKAPLDVLVIDHILKAPTSN